MRGDVENLKKTKPELVEKAKQYFGVELDTLRLRLLPYLQYLAVNSMRIDRNKINGDERKIIQSLKQPKHILLDSNNVVNFSKDFWDFTSEILYYSYTNYSEVNYE